MRTLLTIAAGLALSACAANPEYEASRKAEASRDLGKALEGRTAGTPQDCITPNGLSGPQIIDSRTILYTGGGRIWRVDLPEACPALGPFSTMIVEIRGSQLCSIDMFRVIDAGTSIPSGYCRFGKFTPYTRTKAN